MLIFTTLLAYLLGSLAFGPIVARTMGLGDLRRIGSGNIGATNVLRTGSRAAALLTLLGDAGKATAAVVVARWLTGEAGAGIAALAAILGHMYPVFLSFRGGKGVATAFGAILGLAPVTAFAAFLTWLATAYATRYSSLAAIVAAALAPVYALILYHPHGAALLAILAALIVWSHRGNIARLRRGSEPKIGAGR